ncbi:2-C-methyl-D-erythritol 4-phosphate cytidylyltransferase [Luminiphilus sp.]|nr:2-C-methyl-D-erythritol 4-phosphate cytidylyltransferase [Luminiphilus sp.]MDB2643571.1 2-C-methyl-D-erythritol 4-phosphate cytidylyltransferase [Luminiphilus sp.]MDC1117114.1 2-C-methyl-D-erythritol 4-phosphate cytidylyltransferase [Luminiphilus sp.]
MKSIWAVVPAAGAGRRLGGDIPKQYREVAGAPLMEHTLRSLLQSPDIRGVVVAIDPSDRRADVIASLSDVRVQTTPGGVTRAHSVLAGLDALENHASEGDWALVHDAARPCLTFDALAALIDRARVLGEGVILAEPVADTLKQVNGEGKIEKTVDRSILWRAQTPQLFPLQPLRDALRHCIDEGVSVTDEAMAMERASQAVHVVEGASSNIKVTVEADLVFAEVFLREAGDR